MFKSHAQDCCQKGKWRAPKENNNTTNNFNHEWTNKAQIYLKFNIQWCEKQVIEQLRSSSHKLRYEIRRSFKGAMGGKGMVSMWK